MKRKVFLVMFFVLVVLSACSNQDKDVANQVTASDDASDEDDTIIEENVEDRVVSDTDVSLIMDNILAKNDFFKMSQKSYLIDYNIDLNKSIGYDKIKLYTSSNIEVRFQESDNGMEMLVNGEGVFKEKKKNYSLDIQMFYGGGGDKKAFFFCDPTDTSDWYFLESDMLDVLANGAEEYEQNIEGYLYSSTAYESKYEGKECYQLILNMDKDDYVDYLTSLFKTGGADKYWNMWLERFPEYSGISFNDFIDGLDLETSIYVSKEDYSFVAVRIYADGIDFNIMPLDGAHNSIVIPDAVEANAEDYMNASIREGFIEYISRKMHLFGYTPSPYFDIEKQEVTFRKQDESIYRFLVPEGYLAFDSSEGEGQEWFLVEDDEMTGTDFNMIGPGHLEVPYIRICENTISEDSIGKDIDYDSYTEVWNQYNYYDDVIYVMKRSYDGYLDYDILYPYDSMGDTEYVLAVFTNYGDYSIDSEELQELVFSILE